MAGFRISSSLLQYWQLFVIIFTPCLLLPIFFLPAEDDPKKFKCAYVILLLAVYWMTEALPMAVTALIPVVLFPLVNIQSTDAVCQNYMKESVMMFFAGICLALSIECSGLHKRIALRIMILVGTSLWRLLLGLMVTSFFLSCWIIINSGVVAMLVPIVNSLLDDLPETAQASLKNGPNKKKLTTLFFLAVGYASNIGGTAVIIGSNPNLVAKGILSAENIGQNGKYTDINYATWIAYGMPIAIINVAISFIFLGFAFLGLPNWCRRRSQSLMEETGTTTQESEESTRRMLRAKLAELGPMSFHETCVLVLYIFVMIIWFTNDPQIFTGWSSIFDESYVKVGDSTIALAFVTLMFIIPKEFSSSSKGSSKERPGTLLNWTFLQQKLPWNVVLLVGGGFAISDGVQKSGLSKWIGEQLSGLENLSDPVVLLISLLLISCLTEVLSNSVCVSVILPILIALSKQLDLHPLYLSLPGAIASQFSFTLPISNPTNAIVFTAANMRTLDMAKAGFFLNFACLAVLFAMNLAWGQVIFSYDDYVYAPVGNKTTRE